MTVRTNKKRSGLNMFRTIRSIMTRTKKVTRTHRKGLANSTMKQYKIFRENYNRIIISINKKGYYNFIRAITRTKSFINYLDSITPFSIVEMKTDEVKESHDFLNSIESDLSPKFGVMVNNRIGKLSKYLVKNKKKKIAKKRPNIPKRIKTMVWEKYVGIRKGTCMCFCCKKYEISQTNFHCGHIISHKQGGELTVRNMRPICAECNLSMGSKNMKGFIKQWKL